MSEKIDKLSSALGLINIALPGVVSLVASFGDGQEVDIKKLLDDTDDRLGGILASTDSFLNLPDPDAEEPE